MNDPGSSMMLSYGAKATSSVEVDHSLPATSLEFSLILLLFSSSQRSQEDRGCCWLVMRLMSRCNKPNGLLRMLYILIYKFEVVG